MSYRDNLPSEVLVAIQRVLELDYIPSDDPFEGLSSTFDPVAILNGMFPNGVSVLCQTCRILIQLSEAALAHTEVIQARLAESQREVQREIDELQAELKLHQDPNRMQSIQEMISV